MLSLNQTEFKKLVKYINDNRTKGPELDATTITIAQSVLVKNKSQVDVSEMFDVTRQRVNYIVKKFEKSYKRLRNISEDSVCFQVCVPKNKVSMFKQEMEKMIKNEIGLSLG